MFAFRPLFRILRPTPFVSKAPEPLSPLACRLLDLARAVTIERARTQTMAKNLKLHRRDSWRSDSARPPNDGYPPLVASPRTRPKPSVQQTPVFSTREIQTSRHGIRFLPTDISPPRPFPRQGDEYRSYDLLGFNELVPASLSALSIHYTLCHPTGKFEGSTRDGYVVSKVSIVSFRGCSGSLSTLIG